jgi:phosphatidylglycerophosphate synthase
MVSRSKYISREYINFIKSNNSILQAFVEVILQFIMNRSSRNLSSKFVHLVLAIFCAMRQSFFMAHLLIFLGYEFDRFDGIVARYRDECSEMGKQLDSFCDLVRDSCTLFPSLTRN